MQSITERKKSLRRGAVCSVLVFEVIQLGCIGGFTALCLIPDLSTWCVILFTALAVLCICPAIGALTALRRRIREIEGGELDAAAQY